MSHPLLLALFDTRESAARGAQAVRRLGVPREDLSIVARTHDEEGQLARELDGTPGVDIEDSRVAARLGELSAQVLAAMAVVMPGIGPIVAAGPLSAELGEAAGHAAGGVASVLERTGVEESLARSLQEHVERGSVLLGVHVIHADVEQLRKALEQSDASHVALASWE